MAIDEGFGITIAEAEACVTPAAVIDLVVGKLRASDERVCISQRVFHLLRKGLTRTFGVSRRKVELAADIRSFTAGKSERSMSACGRYTPEHAASFNDALNRGC